MKARARIFTDGACSGNPGPGGWGSIVSIEGGTTVELGGGETETTNNRMELTATIRAIQELGPSPSGLDVILFTDSKYVIDGITKWIHGWKKNGWKSSNSGDSVKNRDLWEELHQVVVDLEKSSSLKWGYVPGHSGIAGNERCDEIAVAFSQNQELDLFCGLTADYSISMDVDPLAAKVKPYYLSLIGGVLARDESWPDCQKRVKGAKGAKFKKIGSSTEETVVLRTWGWKSKS